ncbi:hypothetical protein FQA39_LY14030 [Lamprigera yunnana]|nr:hypothetical protein FQA39_LY14030 [Lamprigera yunnana]
MGEIVNFTKLSTDAAKSIREVLTTFSENLAALRLLEMPVDQRDFILFDILIKLDFATLKSNGLISRVTGIGKLCAYFRVKVMRKTDQLKANFINFDITQPNEYVAELKLKRNTDGLCQVAVMKMAAVNRMHSERARNEQFTPTRI